MTNNKPQTGDTTMTFTFLVTIRQAATFWNCSTLKANRVIMEFVNAGMIELKYNEDGHVCITKSELLAIIGE
jgi:hypothetical protein